MRNTLPDALRDKTETAEAEEAEEAVETVTVEAEAEEAVVMIDPVVVIDLTVEREAMLLRQSQKLPQPNEYLSL